MALGCEQIQSEFSALLDDELNSEDRELVEEHLAECADCLRELHGLKQVNDAYRYHHPMKAPADFDDLLRERMAPTPARFGATWSPMRLAAAAAIVVGIGLAYWRVSDQAPGMFQVSHAPEYSAADIAEEKAIAPEAPPQADEGAMESRLGIAPPPLTETPQEFGPPEASEIAPTSASDTGDADAGTFMEESEATAGARTEETSDGTRRARSNGGFGGGGGGFGGGDAREGFGGGGGGFGEAVQGSSGAGDTSRMGRTGPAADSPPVEMEPLPAPAPPTPQGTPEPPPNDVAMKAAAPPAPDRTESVAPSPEPRQARAIAESDSAPEPIQWRERPFQRVDGTLQQADYDGEALQEVTLLTDAWNAILDSHPDLVELVNGTRPVIVRLGDTWYRFSPAKAE